MIRFIVPCLLAMLLPIVGCSSNTAPPSVEEQLIEESLVGWTVAYRKTGPSVHKLFSKTTWIVATKEISLVSERGRLNQVLGRSASEVDFFILWKPTKESLSVSIAYLGEGDLTPKGLRLSRTPTRRISILIQYHHN